MSIPLQGVLSRIRPTILQAYIANIKQLNFKLVKQISVEFDPFHRNASEMRRFLFHISGPKVQATNPLCTLKTNVVCDRREPTVRFDLAAGGNVIFKSEHLNALNLLELCNKYISSQVPEDPEVVAQRLDALSKVKKKKLPKNKKKLFKFGSKRRPREELYA